MATPSTSSSSGPRSRKQRPGAGRPAGGADATLMNAVRPAAGAQHPRRAVRALC